LTDNEDTATYSQSDDTGLSAFYQQSQRIGWDNLLRGRISKLWGEAVFQASIERQRVMNKRQWAAKFIEALLLYSHSLWKYRCALLHGRSMDEVHQKRTYHLKTQIEAAYVAFSEDLHIVHHSSRDIFLVPLEERLRQDIDSLQCFLRSYKLARLQQEQLNQSHKDAVAQFFLPRSLPRIIAFSGVNEMSTCSDCTPASQLFSSCSCSQSTAASEQHPTKVAHSSPLECPHAALDCSTLSRSTDDDLADENLDVALLLTT
jgi:hypothetical protein